MFTSKLPVSSSVRRPTINGDGSTSFIGQNRVSSIPVSVRKANLFTPQTNRRPFMRGGSTAGKSSMSGMTTDRKQPRSLKPNPDREEQMVMFDTLVNFLRTNADHITPPEPKKFFASVSTSESSRIFEFLISRLLLGFKINKLETSVPDALAQLEYPYIRSVTRSALVSVTTRSAAVGLLVIFDWLIEFINTSETPEDDEFDEDPEYPTRVSYNNVALYGESAKEASKAYFHKLYPMADLRSEEEELIQVREEIARLKDSLQENEDLELEVITLDENCAKWEDYYKQMRIYMETKRGEEKELVQSISESKIEYEEFAKRGAKLDSDIRSHELTIEDVEKLRTKNGMLESDLSLKLAQLKDSEVKDNETVNDHKRLLNELKDWRVKTAADLRKLLDVYASHDAGSKLGAERKDEISEWICRMNQIPYEDVMQNSKLKRDLDLFRQKLRGTDSRLEDGLADGLPTLESECDQYKAAIEDYPKALEKMREKQQSKELELAQLESEKQVNQLRLTESLVKEDQSRLELKEAHDIRDALLVKEITARERAIEEDMKGNVEIDEEHKQDRYFLQKQIYEKASRLLDKTKNDGAKWRAARAIAEKNNEVVKRALRRVRRLKNQKK